MYVLATSLNHSHPALRRGQPARLLCTEVTRHIVRSWIETATVSRVNRRIGRMRKHRYGLLFPLNTEHLFAYNTIYKHTFGVWSAMEKYIGQRIEIIYMAADGRLTQRTIRVLDVQGGVVLAFCMASRAPRTFRVENILAAMPARRKRTA